LSSPSASSRAMSRSSGGIWWSSYVLWARRLHPRRPRSPNVTTGRGACKADDSDRRCGDGPTPPPHGSITASTFPPRQFASCSAARRRCRTRPSWPPAAFQRRLALGILKTCHFEGIQRGQRGTSPRGPSIEPVEVSIPVPPVWRATSFMGPGSSVAC
jgi:hypothetical protein